MAEVDTDALINQAIDARAQREARRQNIDAQSQRLSNQLGTTKRRDRGRIAQLQSELQGLQSDKRAINAEQHSADNEMNLRVQSQFRNAHLSDKALENQRHDETARQVTNINNGIARLEAKYPNRGYDAGQSDKFYSEIQKLGSENEVGQLNQGARQNLFKAAQFHDQVRQKTLSNAARNLSTLTKGGLTPDEFANRDQANDFTTNAADLTSAQSKDINVSKRPKQGEPIGVNTVFQAGGANWMIPTTSFSHFDSNFTKQPTAQTAPIDQPLTPDQGIQPLIPTYGGQGAAPPGGLVRNPDGSIAPIIPTYGGEGAAPPGALVRTGVARIGTPPPTGVPIQEQIVQPGTTVAPQPDLSPQPIATPAPQVSQQPIATPHPMEGKAVRNKQSGQMGTIVNGIFVPDQQ